MGIGVTALIDLTEYTRSLHDACPNGVLAVLVRGSYAHGCATSESDVDLLVITSPSDKQILLGETGQIVSLHDPDITVMSPLAYARLLVKGAPNMVETLMTPLDCVLAVSSWLTDLRAQAPLLLSKSLLRMVCGNVRANLHRVNTVSDVRRQWKLLGESWRLIMTAYAALDSGVWSALLDDAQVCVLRWIRRNGCDAHMLAEMLDRLCERVESSGLPEKSVNGDRVLDTVTGLYRLIVTGGRTQIVSTALVVDRLREFMEMNAVG